MPVGVAPCWLGSGLIDGQRNLGLPDPGLVQISEKGPNRLGIGFVSFVGVTLLVESTTKTNLTVCFWAGQPHAQG